MCVRTLSSWFLYVKSRLCKTGKNALKVLLQYISLPRSMEDFIIYFLFCFFIFHNTFPGPWALSEGVVTFLRCILPILGQMVNNVRLGKPCWLFLIPVLHLYEPLFCVVERRAPSEKYLTCKAFKQF